VRISLLQSPFSSSALSPSLLLLFLPLRTTGVLDGSIGRRAAGTNDQERERERERELSTAGPSIANSDRSAANMTDQCDEFPIPSDEISRPVNDPDEPPRADRFYRTRKTLYVSHTCLARPFRSRLQRRPHRVSFVSFRPDYCQ